DGEGVNYNSYWWHGAPAVEFTAVKARGGPPAVGSPPVLGSRFVPQVLATRRPLLRPPGATGYACTELKRHPQHGRLNRMAPTGPPWCGSSAPSWRVCAAAGGIGRRRPRFGPRGRTS